MTDQYEAIRYSVADGVATITLDRPDSLNAFSGQMGRELQDAYRRSDADDTVRVVILTGAGRAFCAGADFSGGSGVFDSQEGKTEFNSDPFEYHAWDVRKPVIAALNGHAIGLGLTMALQTDIRIVADDAKLGIVQNRRGVLPDARSHWTLPRLVGYSRATELLLTGRRFSGADAAAWGLAVEAVPADEVLPRATEMARDIATNVAPLSVGLSKRLLWRSKPSTSDEINDLECRIHLELLGRPDSREGVMAFLEKRDPVWTLSASADWPDWIDEDS
jgi:enoyl-CoA hydratase/carnithine racemase